MTPEIEIYFKQSYKLCTKILFTSQRLQIWRQCQTLEFISDKFKIDATTIFTINTTIKYTTNTTIFTITTTIKYTTNTTITTTNDNKII
jgi:hypothetical protein